MVPLSCLAAILLVTGFKLASPAVFQKMWKQGRYQFVPFIVTVVAIVFTDLLIGILIGLGIALSFILNSNLRRPIRRFVEHHLGGDVLHIELANQVSFLNRAVLSRVLHEVPRGGQVLLDAQSTDYIDPDVLDLIREYRDRTAPARGVEVSFLGLPRKVQAQGPDRVRRLRHARAAAIAVALAGAENSPRTGTNASAAASDSRAISAAKWLPPRRASIRWPSCSVASTRARRPN